MRTAFRQGLVSSEINASSQPNYLTVNNSGITLRAVNRPIVFTLAEGTKNYTITFHTDVLAWPTALFNNVPEAWLWIDINKANATRSYGISTVPLVYGSVAPTNPAVGQHWFDRTRNVMRVFNENGGWQQVLRVFAGHYTTTSTSSSAYGTQVGLTLAAVSGEILRDGSGRAITDSSGLFLTTEDVVLIDGASTYAAKLEANVDVAPAAQAIAAFHVVRYNDDGWLIPADYDDVSECVLGLATVNAVPDEPVSLVLQGKVYNEMWNWSHANITLWVNQNGDLVETDPFDLGGRAKRRVPIARTIDSKTIIFDQGLGGVGEKGDTGSVSDIPLATGTEPGITRLSVEPEEPTDPIAVGDNDPRLTDPRTPLEHTHPATAITVSPFGTFNGTNAQQALEHLQTVKLNLSGGTVTGPIVSTVTATQDNHLVTLGQAKNEITARAVTERRYLLNSGSATIVQAFNALTPAQRTLPVNTIVVVEYRGETFVWSGGYGTPVAATDSGQFLLIGRLSVEIPPLTFKVQNAFAVYEGNQPAPPPTGGTAMMFTSNEDFYFNRAITLDLTTGELTAQQGITSKNGGNPPIVQFGQTLVTITSIAGRHAIGKFARVEENTWSLERPFNQYVNDSDETVPFQTVKWFDISADKQYLSVTHFDAHPDKHITVFNLDTGDQVFHKTWTDQRPFRHFVNGNLVFMLFFNEVTYKQDMLAVYSLDTGTLEESFELPLEEQFYQLEASIDMVYCSIVNDTAQTCTVYGWPTNSVPTALDDNNKQLSFDSSDFSGGFVIISVSGVPHLITFFESGVCAFNLNTDERIDIQVSSDVIPDYFMRSHDNKIAMLQAYTDDDKTYVGSVDIVNWTINLHEIAIAGYPTEFITSATVA